MIYLLYTIHLIVCVFLIMVVLLQQGKGADLSVFGGGSTQTAFGARGATTLLHKLTVASFVLFIVTTMSIAVLQGSVRTSSVMGNVMEQELEETPATAPEAAAPAAEQPAAEQPAAGDTSAPPPAPAEPPAGDGGGSPPAP